MDFTEFKHTIMRDSTDHNVIGAGGGSSQVLSGHALPDKSRQNDYTEGRETPPDPVGLVALDWPRMLQTAIGLQTIEVDGWIAWVGREGDYSIREDLKSLSRLKLKKNGIRMKHSDGEIVPESLFEDGELENNHVDGLGFIMEGVISKFGRTHWNTKEGQRNSVGEFGFSVMCIVEAVDNSEERVEVERGMKLMIIGVYALLKRISHEQSDLMERETVLDLFYVDRDVCECGRHVGVLGIQWRKLDSTVLSYILRTGFFIISNGSPNDEFQCLYRGLIKQERGLGGLRKRGINLLLFMKKKLGKWPLNVFWDEVWCDGGKLKNRFHRASCISKKAKHYYSRINKLALLVLLHSFRKIERRAGNSLKLRRVSEECYYRGFDKKHDSYRDSLPKGDLKTRLYFGEYACTTRINERIDIYNFGVVVLLELVTGSEANEGDGDINLAEWAWKHFCEGDSIMKDVLEILFVWFGVIKAVKNTLSSCEDVISLFVTHQLEELEYRVMMHGEASAITDSVEARKASSIIT
ncbi:hypothetical protein Tco_0127782 [Tanacetum coccineum]